MDEPVVRLLAAVVFQAVSDARQTMEPALAAEARRWLGETGQLIVAQLGFPPANVAAWLAGLWPLPYEQLELWSSGEGEYEGALQTA